MSDAANKRTWMITGISRGLGLALAKAVLAAGHTVIGTTRSGEADLSHERLTVLPMELTDGHGIRQMVAQAFARQGTIDVIVNNAGYGLLGAVEEASEEEMRHVSEANLLGPISLIRACLPHLRRQRHGHVINVSSIAALAPMAGSALYAGAKSGLEGVCRGLAQEVEPLGIRVSLIEPGAFRTDFLTDHSARISPSRIDDYRDTAGAAVAYLGSIHGQQVGDPARAAEVIMALADDDANTLQLVLGADAIRRTREAQQRLTEDLTRWETRSVATAFDA